MLTHPRADLDLLSEFLSKACPRARETTARAAALLAAHGGLAGLSALEAHELVPSLTAREAAVLEAALTLGARARERALTPKTTSLRSAADVAAWARPRLAQLEHEELWVISLDARSRLKRARAVATGGRHGLAASVADVLRLALRDAASAIVVVHNHPSGDPTPSEEDRAFTRSLSDAARVVAVPLVDHVVVASEGFRSVDT